MLYTNLIRPLLFSFPPEAVHHFALSVMTRTPAARLIEPYACCNFPKLEKKLFGLTFPNPVGLAAGFDKNADGITTWEMLGFGFMELGTITPKGQPGNSQPRVFRLPSNQSLINRMGFPNVGMDVVAAILEETRAAGQWPKIPVGINLGKNKDTALADAGTDYLACFRRTLGLADYYVVNVSSPNTPGLRELQQGQFLDSILGPLREEDPTGKCPLLIKISPDLTEAQVSDVVQAAEKYKLAGIIATNTTTDKSGLSLQEEGGASGRCVTAKSTEIIRIVHKLTQLPIIGVGGIFNAQDAKEKLEAGASLLQVYTGFIYQGPCIARQICEGL